MEEDRKFQKMVPRLLYLTLFVIGLLFMFNLTSFMGYPDQLRLADRRMACFVISLFGMVGFFVEVILDRIKEK